MKRDFRNNQKPTDKKLQVRTKRTCKFCDHKIDYIDFKDEKRIIKLINEQGKILPKRISGTCSKHQRKVVAAIKRGRHMAMLPFVADAMR